MKMHLKKLYSQCQDCNKQIRVPSFIINDEAPLRECLHGIDGNCDIYKKRNISIMLII